MRTGAYRLHGTVMDVDTKRSIALNDDYVVVIDGVLARIARRILYEQTLEQNEGESDEGLEARARAGAPAVLPIVEPFEHEHRVRMAEVATIAEPLD